MRLGSLVCGLLISIIYLMVSYIFNGVWKVDHAVKYCILWCMHIMRVLFCVFCMPIHWRSPPPPLHTIDNSTFTLSLYFLLKYVLPPVLFTLTQVVLLLITSTFTRVQIQSNLGTTVYMLLFQVRYRCIGDV